MDGKSTADGAQPEMNKCETEECDSAPVASKDSAITVDGRIFRRPKDVKPVYRSNVDAASELYDMNHRHRGIAIIFNHVNFKKMQPRMGAAKDSNDLVKTLKYLGFDVRLYMDPSLKTISSVLETAAAEDHTDADCLIVAAMSHGESGVLHAYENEYPVEILWNGFTGNRCPSLAGKPKLFFIQACRGTQLDNGVQIMHETDSVGTYSVPAYADIMVAYSSYDGFYSFRNPETGSWFIQALCQELNQNWRTRDLLRMMTSVVRRVAIDYQSFVPQDAKFHAKKQVPSIVSMLTRLVFFGETPPEYRTSKSDKEMTEKDIVMIA